MQLFDEYPYLENETIVIKKMSAADADALSAFAKEEAVYRYLPTFLGARIDIRRRAGGDAALILRTHGTKRKRPALCGTGLFLFRMRAASIIR